MSIVLGLAAAVVAAAPAAWAQSSVKAVFEKHKLLGTFAWDCGKPASDSNLYYTHRALDGGSVQHDQMNSATSRQYVMIFESATEMKPGELTITGTREGKPVTMVWRAEQNRVRRLEMSVGSDTWIAAGRYKINGNEVPLLTRCGE